ncbi:MAG TPA: hypothetical protein VGK96_28385 [Candidatus Sulfotelmatobacter sp.]|jgi:hypothetical protein
MAIQNGIIVGSTGTFSATLQDNGATIALPAGSTYAWTSLDPEVSFDTSADPTGASVVVTVAAADTSQDVTITATATAPDGNPATGSLTFPVLPVAQKFTILVQQTGPTV